MYRLSSPRHPPSYSSYIHLEILIEIFFASLDKNHYARNGEEKKKAEWWQDVSGIFPEVFHVAHVSI